MSKLAAHTAPTRYDVVAFELSCGREECSLERIGVAVVHLKKNSRFLHGSHDCSEPFRRNAGLTAVARGGAAGSVMSFVRKHRRTTRLWWME